MEIRKATDRDYANVIVSKKEREKIRKEAEKFLEESRKKVGSEINGGR